MTQTGMKKSPEMPLEPRFENGKAMLIAGLRKHYSSETMNDIPEQWQRFVVHIGKVPNEVGRVAYGVCANFVAAPFSFDYLSGSRLRPRRTCPKTSASPRFQRCAMRFLVTKGTYRRFATLSMPSGTSGCRIQDMRL